MASKSRTRKTAARSIAAYFAKMDVIAANSPEQTKARIEGMKANFASAASTNEQVTLQVAAIAAGLTPALTQIFYTPFLRIGRQYFSIAQKFTGPPANAAAQVVHATWVSNGGDSAASISLALQLANLTVV